MINLQDQLGITFIVVTHDQEEAMTLATRIAVMNKGKFIQTGTPNQIYEFPANRLVADFFGTINLFEGTVDRIEDDRMMIKSSEIATELKAGPGDSKRGDAVSIAVRPEKISITTEPVETERTTCMKGTIWDIGYYGNYSIYRIKINSGKTIQVSSQNQTRLAERELDWDEEVYVSWDLSSSIVLTE